jgi:hypothetical protein
MNRCQSLSPRTKTEGRASHVQCGLPVGHKGQHQNGSNCLPWDDAPIQTTGLVTDSPMSSSGEQTKEMLYGDTKL